MKTSFKTLRIGALILAACALQACDSGPKGQAPAQPVAFVTIASQAVPVTNELSGRLESYRTAEIRARVAGVIQKRSFTEGNFVKEGKLLFQIDPRSYQATYNSAAAALARAKANFVQADLKMKRYEPLVEINAISKQEFDDSIAAQKQAAADVASAKANLDNARLNLEYAAVSSPIPGKIGRAMVTEGALVGQNEPTLLATVQQIDPIYLNLTQSSAQVLELRKAIAAGTLKSGAEKSIPVSLTMEDGTPYPYKGKLLFSDISVDPSTGELAVRAIFPNPKHLLLPGMYVKAKIDQAVNENALLVPQQAVTFSSEGASVMVINKDNKVEPRAIKTGASIGNFWVVGQGLEPGDRVIVEGLQKVRPGAPVTPVPWEAKKDDKAAADNPDAAAKPAPEAAKAAPEKAAETTAQPAGDGKAVSVTLDPNKPAPAQQEQSSSKQP